jgi:hypothetical protein
MVPRFARLRSTITIRSFLSRTRGGIATRGMVFAHHFAAGAAGSNEVMVVPRGGRPVGQQWARLPDEPQGSRIRAL